MNLKKTFPKNVPLSMTAKQIVMRVDDSAIISCAEGNMINTIASPKEAKSGSLVFCSAVDIDEIQKIVSCTEATVIITSAQVKSRPGVCIIVTKDPLSWFIKALNILFDFSIDRVIHSTAIISDNATIGKNVSIGAGTVVNENCIIGNGCVIGSNCYFASGVILDENVLIREGVSIGVIGLGYHNSEKEGKLFFPHMGSVLIGNEVVIGSGSVIVRGEMNDTIIKNKTKIGNLVNIGHNVVIGRDCAISSGTSVAGGSVIGDRCNIAMNVSINAKVSVGNDCQIGLGSVVVRSVPSGKSIFGSPAKLLPTMRKF